MPYRLSCPFIAQVLERVVLISSVLTKINLACVPITLLKLQFCEKFCNKPTLVLLFLSLPSTFGIVVCPFLLEVISPLGVHDARYSWFPCCVPLPSFQIIRF